MRFARLTKTDTVVTGMFLGLLLGIATGIGAATNVVPMWAALFGILCVYSAQPFCEGTGKGFLVLFLLFGNAGGYSLSGGCLGVLAWRLLVAAGYAKAARPAPQRECPVCGHRASWPQSAACPSCGTANVFRAPMQRTGAPRCPRCSYLLIGAASDRCPECGYRLCES
jgi:DNA-directed RNA polymerase subunit RPC12/RpoP